HDAVAGFGPDTILSRSEAEAVKRAGCNANVPASSKVIHGAAGGHLRGCGAREPVVRGNVPLRGVTAGNGERRSHLVIGGGGENSDLALQRRCRLGIVMVILEFNHGQRVPAVALKITEGKSNLQAVLEMHAVNRPLGLGGSQNVAPQEGPAIREA